MSNKITWEYLAGFTDGEGSFQFRKCPSTVGPTCRMPWPQKNTDVLEQIVEFLESHGLHPKLYHYSRALSCVVLNRQAEVWFVLESLVDHLIVKHAQANEVIIALEAHLTKRGVFVE